MFFAAWLLGGAAIPWLLTSAPWGWLVLAEMLWYVPILLATVWQWLWGMSGYQKAISAQTIEEIRDILEAGMLRNFGGRFGTYATLVISVVSIVWFSVNSFLYLWAGWQSWKHHTNVVPWQIQWTLYGGAVLAVLLLLFLLYLYIVREKLWVFRKELPALLPDVQTAENFLSLLSERCPFAEIKSSSGKTDFVTRGFFGLVVSAFSFLRNHLGLQNAILPFLDFLSAVFLMYVVFVVVRWLFIEFPQYLPKANKPSPCAYVPLMRLAQYALRIRSGRIF